MRHGETPRQGEAALSKKKATRGDNNDAMPVSHCASLEEAVAMLAGEPLLFEPGTQYRYSIWGWVLVSAVIEGPAGEAFDRFMVRQVFESRHSLA
jgi:CubicO group peptidase (beta-lactamase class C family)